MKILVIGGIAKSLINFRGPLLKAMVQRGHKVFSASGQTTPQVANALKQIGVEHHDIPFDRTGLNPFTDIIAMIKLAQLIRKVKPEITLGYTIKPVTYGSIAAKASGVPRICSMIEGLGYAFTGNTLKHQCIRQICMLLYKIGLKDNFALFFLNPDDRHYFIQKHLLGRIPNVMVLNGIGVDLDHYRASPLPKEPSFIVIARLLKDKGIGEYAEAARLLKQKYPHIICRLVGDTDSNPACIPLEQVSQWDRDGIIEYLGYIQDVRPAIASSSVYVLPSYREGTPRTVLEAMAMGRPIITTDAPGCRETVERKEPWARSSNNGAVMEGENGFLVPVRNSVKLAEAMERFIAQPDLIERMGKRSHEIAVEKYDVHKVNAVILEAMGL